MLTTDTEVQWRTEGDVFRGPLGDVGTRALRDAIPWRTVRSFHGKAHYAGWYWSATTKGFVTYESRLELECLLLADQDPTVAWIVSQPFHIAGIDSRTGRRRRHVPDFAFIDGDDTVLVTNVKPADRLTDERVRAALDWAALTFRSRGWRHDIWTGSDPVHLANVRFLAAYRMAERCSPDALTVVASMAGERTSIAELEKRCGCEVPLPLGRPAVLHQLWTGGLLADLHQPLDRHTTVWPGPRPVGGVA
jgi:hypothetical protein